MLTYARRHTRGQDASPCGHCCLLYDGDLYMKEYGPLNHWNLEKTIHWQPKSPKAVQCRHKAWLPFRWRLRMRLTSTKSLLLPEKRTQIASLPLTFQHLWLLFVIEVPTFHHRWLAISVRTRRSPRRGTRCERQPKVSTVGGAASHDRDGCWVQAWPRW